MAVALKWGACRSVLILPQDRLAGGWIRVGTGIARRRQPDRQRRVPLSPGGNENEGEHGSDRGKAPENLHQRQARHFEPNFLDISRDHIGAPCMSRLAHRWGQYWAECRFSNPITIATARAKRNASAGLSSTPAAIIEYCGAIEASMPVPVKRGFAPGV